jgi:DNA polymerase II large subunit
MAAYLLYVLEETKNKIYETLDLAEKVDVKNIHNNKLSGDDILSMLSNVTKLLSVQKLIHDVIEANGSFEKFRKIKTKNNSDFSDIDELINKALKNKDDE